MSAASLLRQARAAARISQRELALRGGTSQARVSRVEQGLEEPSYRQLASLIEACGLELVCSVRRPEAERTVEDLLRAAELSRFLTSVSIAARRDG
jgi:transcriptional regulator with XRE-family HTH domain